MERDTYRFVGCANCLEPGVSQTEQELRRLSQIIDDHKRCISTVTKVISIAISLSCFSSMFPCIRIQLY